MALSATELARLTRMVGESQKETADRELTAADLQDIADEVGQMFDADGNTPADSAYVDTYDLYRTAAECWRTKAGMVSEQFDFEAEGGSFSRSQKFRNYLAQASRYANMAPQQSTRTGSVT